ncbi:MAG: 2-amino-4-hydroxy-6-hydroxymethyldihydropteridine diphosphokinase [Candidatus Cloacimonetes bacterium]|nr:2-amino-4-hydroxy-6-hydroxymethyldihydropteridine diphosphokinase [Candidatus Cloacimonadota bacterium]
MMCYLGLGSNMGDRKEEIRKAISYLSSNPRINVLKESTIIETEPIGNINQPKFLNCALKIETDLDAVILLKTCLNIEFNMGRIRTRKWEPRIIDIDILFYGKQVIDEGYITIPHTELHRREFVMRSLNEICPDFEHPVLKKRMKDIFMELK